MAGRLKAVPDASRDLISELPLEVKDRILGCLHTQEAARTAMLSKHWNDVWLQHGRLTFDWEFLQCVEQCYDDEDYILEVKSRWLAPHLKVIKTLWLCGSSLWHMDVSVFPTAINLQVMKLYDLDFGCRKQLAVALQLLQKCPNLCELHIIAYKSCWNDDKEDASRLLEDPNSGFVIQELKMLNTIKIESFSEFSLEMLFMKMLLSNSPVLERVVIVKSWGMNASEVRKIQRKLECFPRASPNAQIVCAGNYRMSMRDDWFNTHGFSLYDI